MVAQQAQGGGVRVTGELDQISSDVCMFGLILNTLTSSMEKIINIHLAVMLSFRIALIHFSKLVIKHFNY